MHRRGTGARDWALHVPARAEGRPESAAADAVTETQVAGAGSGTVLRRADGHGPPGKRASRCAEAIGRRWPTAGWASMSWAACHRWPAYDLRRPRDTEPAWRPPAFSTLKSQADLMQERCGGAWCA